MLETLKTFLGVVQRSYLTVAPFIALVEPTHALLLLAPAAVNGISSVVSSVVKDRDVKPLMKVVNFLAVNYGKAENTKVSNQI